jgi:Zn2+/Cd2+-exporting ATPase
MSHYDHHEHKHEHGSERKDQCCCCHGHDHSHEKTAASSGNLLLLNPDAQGRVQTVLRVAGMDCADEVVALEESFRPIKGVREARVNLVGGKVTLFHDESVTAELLIQAVVRAGMTAVVDGGKSGETLEDAKFWRQMVVGISGVAMAVGLILEWFKVGPDWVADIPYGIAIIAGGWFVVPKAFRALARLSLDMNVLMSVAAFGALAIHQWSEGAAVVFLFALSELLEAFSLARARKAIQSLLQLSPETAWLKKGADYVEVPVAEVAVGSTIAVKLGARIPLDGEVLAGQSAVNQAPITGESMPVDKKAGDIVYAGTINGSGSLEVRTTKVHSETTLARMIHLVEEAQSQKAPAQRFVDVFAKYYTPLVMVGAILVALIPPLLAGGEWLTWVYRGLVLLVIACPCALVISTPVSVVSGLTALARRGVLVKGGGALESLGKLEILAVDKTGTITEGKPRVTRVVPWNGAAESEILRLAAAIDAHSQHPLAQAVVSCAQERGISYPRSEGYQAFHGRGAEGEVEGHSYFVGNHRLAHELGVCSPELEEKLAGIEADAQSVVVVGHKPHGQCRGEVMGVLAVGDAVRSNAVEALKALHRVGVGKVVMLSGDNQRTVDAIARETGIDEARGDLLPDQKIEEIRNLLSEGKCVGMIGDGVNDAPAMAAATVGIAMGGVGTDAAIETADVTLMKDDLEKIAEAIHLGRRTLGIIRFNIGFALSLKAVFLVLAVLGYTSLWLAILADTGATLLVIANALRLLKR